MTHELQQAETSQEATTRQNTLQTTGACTHCLVFSCEEVHDVKRVQYPYQDDLAWKSWSLGLQSSPPFSMLKVDIPSPTVSGRRQDKAVVLPLTGKNHWNLPKSFSFQSKHILMCLFVSCFFFNYYYLFWVALQSCSAFTLWRRLRATRLTQVLLGNNYVLLSCSTQLVHTVRGGAAVLTSVRHLEDLWISRVGVHRL